MKNSKDQEKKKTAPSAAVKPKDPKTTAKPDDNDPNAQYENKDES